MGLIAIDKVWPYGFCFGVQGFWSNNLLAFSFQYFEIGGLAASSMRNNLTLDSVSSPPQQQTGNNILTIFSLFCYMIIKGTLVTMS